MRAPYSAVEARRERNAKKEAAIKEQNEEEEAKKVKPVKPFPFMDLPKGQLAVPPTTHQWSLTKIVDLSMTRTLMPTRQERKLFKSGAWKQPIFNPLWKKKNREMQKDFARLHQGGRLEILARGNFWISAFVGTGILRANKQTNLKAATILYGENAFYFDSSSCHGDSPRRSIKFEPEEIPGITFANGARPTPAVASSFNV